MPRMTTRSKQKSDFYDVDSEQEPMETPKSAGRSPPAAEAPTPITATELSAMMLSLQQAQADNFERLLTLVLEARPTTCSPAAANASAPATPTPSSSSAQPASGNFASCKARYSGMTTESLDGFIDAVEAYKDCANVNEVNCLRGLSMLLTHDAATWWQGVKATVNSWEEALQYLRCAFGDSRPPHRVYIELFSRPQHPQERTELFVASARAQLARLPTGDISEKVQLDMIYGLLKQKIRKRLRREEFSDFNTLLSKTRSIEDSLKETPNVDSSKGTAAAARARAVKSPQQAAQPTAQTSNQRASGSPEPTLRQGTPNVADKEKRFCVYCKNFGHNRDSCRKLNAKDDRNNLNSNKILSCFGCGESGVIRSNCPKCNSKFSAVDFIPTSGTYNPRTPCASSDGKPAAQVSNINVPPVISTGVIPELCSHICGVYSKSSNCVKVNTTLSITEPGTISRNNASSPHANNHSLADSAHPTDKSLFTSITRPVQGSLITVLLMYLLYLVNLIHCFLGKLFMFSTGNNNNACDSFNSKPNHKHRNNCKNIVDSSCHCQTQSRVTMNFPGQNTEIGIPRRATMILSGQNPDSSLPSNRITKLEYERLEHHQDVRKSQADKNRTKAETFVEGDLVLMTTHVLSNSAKGVSSKFVPKRDGPYEIVKKVSPTTYLLAYNKDGTKEVIGKYHMSDLRRYHSREGECPEPVILKRRRGRPRKVR